MVDFQKLLGKATTAPSTDPIQIFNNLDKESGKEYLRPPQEAVLRKWFESHQSQKDLIVKLHTGQGKTLIGLLMLQSSINEGKGPALYLCPNNYLVRQTVTQAASFGIRTIQFEDSKPPPSFLNSRAILVTNCKKLFNGKSVFGVQGSRVESVPVGALVMDDAHKCLDIVRESFSINARRLDFSGRKNPVYSELWVLFEESLKRQAPGTVADIKDGVECSMAVPFWTWHAKRGEVLEVLAKHKEAEDIVFAWDLLKNHIDQCICIFSGDRLEISPRLLPVDLIPSFHGASRRIFLSATLNEDAFLVRDLGLDTASVSEPLSAGDVKYSGERLVLIPTLVDPELSRENVIHWVSGLAQKNGSFGVVGIVPSFGHSEDWKKASSDVTSVQDLSERIESLKDRVKRKDAKRPLVLVNEYDGVDLPDSTCRILCIDSLPSYNTLVDRYMQDMRPSSGVIRRRLAQRVEQGMGRAIRGSSDWCIAVVTGNNLTDFISENSKRAFLSKEAQMQIRIGEELAGELKAEGGHLKVMERLVNQCLNRDDGWKQFYKGRMDQLEPDLPRKEYLDRALAERNAEILYQQGHHKKAVEAIRGLIASADPSDKGWYLQTIAAYMYPVDADEAMETQLKAHSENPRLFRPELGVAYAKLSSAGSRATRIIEWTRHASYNALIIELTSVLDELVFGAPSESFEEALSTFGQALGFGTQRPEKEAGEGPDNLWSLQGKDFWIIECKNRVARTRKEISKEEIGQLNNSIGWFARNYEGQKGEPVIIHPAHALAKGAFPNESAWVLDVDGLKKFKENTLGFYNSLKETKMERLAVDLVRTKLKAHALDTDELSKEYLQRLKTAR
ncbi:MAG TPA: DEAD/DEAH box helicase [Nitrososphaerales archaeon]|nr:DEAD/DEAH box helicase [Nitrososphaerales archaeon]